MLTIKNLSFAFQHHPLFSDFSVDIKPGELVHLVGPNGAGKSTFMSVVAGFRSPSNGSVDYLDSEGNSVDDRKIFIEYLSAEANGLYTSMDATQNLMFWSSLRGLSYSEEEITAELKKWGLGHRLVRLNFPVAKFSTGMGRRLALARIKLSKSQCWLLDEPIYGLDEKGISLFRDMLREHKNNGGLALIISHDTAPLEGLITNTKRLERA